MKKVLIVSTVGLIYDGITSVIVSYLQAMNLEGLDIYVVGTIEIEPNIRNQIESTGCKVIEFPNRKTETLEYFLFMARFIRKNQIKVIHAHGNSGTLAIEMVAAWVGGCKKRIAHSHNTKCDQIKADKLLKPIFNLFYTDGLACGEAAGRWLFGNRKFEVLTNGRDIDKYRFNIQTRENIRKYLNVGNEIVIGHVGGFFVQKNHRFIVEIYRELKRQEPSCKLFMIGDGPLKQQIEKSCSDLNITFTGAIDNIPEYINAMDGMILPSLFEGLPLVAIEWQINGLPCILSDVITRDCKLTDNVVFMSLDREAQEWAKSILAEIKNNNRELSSIKACNMIKDSEFNIKKNAKKLERIYKN